MESICFVDWQIIRYASPATDFIYNLCGTSDTETRTKHFDDLKREYHDQLSSNVRKMGSNPEKVFPYEAFEEEIKLSGVIGLLMAPIITEIALVEAKDITNLDEMFENLANGKQEQIALIQGLGVDAQLKFEKRINECVRDLVNMGLFRKLTKNE